MSTLIFRSFSSGSNGNSYYFGTRDKGLLIDAGISSLQIRKGLRDMAIDIKSLLGVLITHDHADHVRGLGGVAKRFQLPVYATRETFEGLDGNWAVKDKPAPVYRRFINKYTTFQLADFSITPFGVSHDSRDCVGFFIEHQNIHITLATDVGRTDDVLARFVRQSDYVIIEANYDEQLLLNGRYPDKLKKRVISDVGHMCNDTCGAFLAHNYTQRLKKVWLCHLSQNNNTPDIARATVELHLNNAGIDTQNDLIIHTLPRVTPSPVYNLT
ncbi:MAG: MBL fold metallo-hydrolase [Paludibacteraceae bacterium]|nr:MBL fold metallo-hydrolase [Paludibacteraceae bacterium]